MADPALARLRRERSRFFPEGPQSPLSAEERSRCRELRDDPGTSASTSDRSPFRRPSS